MNLLPLSKILTVGLPNPPPPKPSLIGEHTAILRPNSGFSLGLAFNPQLCDGLVEILLKDQKVDAVDLADIANDFVRAPASYILFKLP